MSARFSVVDLVPHLGVSYELRGVSDATFTHPRPIDDADEDALVWLKMARADRVDLLESTPARVIVVPKIARTTPALESRKCFVVVDDPKIAFIRVVRALFARRGVPGIHPSAVVDPGAVIHPESTIGPLAFVGRARIGKGTVIEGHAHIADGVTLGENVVVGAGTVIGADGFGYAKNDGGRWEKFPHLGEVVIGDDVEIGANAVIVRGTLGTTVIGRCTKIDNFVHVGHNAVVGEDVMVAGNAIVGGSSRIGDGAWISPNATILNGRRIGRGANVGAATVVNVDVPDGGTIVSAPGRILPAAFARRT